MNDPQPPACPHCGSHQLIAHQDSRMVFINQAGDSIPLLTANFSLGHPVIQENTTIYTCPCSWAGTEADLVPHG